MAALFGSKKKTSDDVEGAPQSVHQQNKQNHAILTEEIIISSKWMLHYSPIRHKRKIVFKKNGKIGEGQNDWEHSWKFISPGVFATFTKSGDPDVIFANAVLGTNNKWYLCGGAHTITQM